MLLHMQTVCRACGSKDLFDIAHFGNQVPANWFRADLLTEEERFPLLFRMCAQCRLGQLGHVIPKERLYRNYPYITSTSKTMRDYLLGQCQNILNRVNPCPTVVEIGSNTGLYLQLFKERHSPIFGFEPALNLASAANEAGIPTIADFFNQASATQFSAVHGKADVVIGRHVLSRIDCWRAFISALDVIAKPTALIVLEVPYLVELFNQYQFDTIHHEHLSYVSVKSLHALLEDSPFYIQDVERSLVHGGCVVFYLRRRGFSMHHVCAILEHLLTLEEGLELHSHEVWKDWRVEITELRDDIREVVASRPETWTVGYGAAAKGSMLLQWCKLDKQLPFVVDNTPYKQGRFMPGTNIPIEPPAHFDAAVKEKKVGAALVLAWNFAKEIKSLHSNFRGRWIVPIPQVRLE